MRFTFLVVDCFFMRVFGHSRETPFVEKLSYVTMLCYMSGVMDAIFTLVLNAAWEPLTMVIEASYDCIPSCCVDPFRTRGSVVWMYPAQGSLKQIAISFREHPGQQEPPT